MEAKQKKNKDWLFSKGNDYWKIAVEKGTIGRPRIYGDPGELAKKINQWIQITSESVWNKEDFIKSGPQAGQKIQLETSTPFFIQDLCLFLGVNIEYFNDMEKSLENMKDREKANDFSRIISHVKNVITVQKLQGAAVGAYNPLIVSKVEGLTDKQDITSNGKDIQGIASITITREDYKAAGDKLDKDV